MELEIRNSFCRLAGDIPPEVSALVKQVLTYRNDIDSELAALFPKLNYAKRSNNNKMYHMLLGQIKKLKESEWVCWFNNNEFPTGHLNIVREVLKSVGSEYEERDCRVAPTNDLILNWYSRPHELRYYQKEMVELGVKEGRGVFVAAVGAGKSLILAYVLKELSVTSLIIVPSVGLGLQLEQDFKKWFGPGKVETITTKNVRKGKKLSPIRIVTIQTLASLQKSGELQNLVEDVNALFCDEVHHSAANSYTNLLPEIDHIYYRFGFSGSFVRSGSDSLDMWGFLSNVLYRYPAFKAIEEGFLTPVQVEVHSLPGQRSPSYPKEYEKNYCGGEYFLRKIREICELAGDSEQILILVKNKEKSGNIIHEYLKTYGVDNSYISGDDSKEVINGTIKAFNEKQVRVLIGSSVIGEGIDVRSTDQLIMAQGGKSEVVIVQAVGRAVRLYEGKKVARVHDFNFIGTKYLKKHLEQRKNIYSRNFECPILEVED